MQDNEVIEKYCIKNSEDSCSKYGGLYQWNEVFNHSVTNGNQGICPSGWHVPSDSEWKILEGSVDSEYGVGDPEWEKVGARGADAGFKLKSTWGYILNGSGDNSFGFSALPSGAHDYDMNNFYAYRSSGFWWTSSYYLDYGYYHAVHHMTSQSSRAIYDKRHGFSVRCIKD